MQNTVIGSLLFLGGIYVSLGNNKTQGTILLLTLLLIVSISIIISLQPQASSTEYFEDAAKNSVVKNEQQKEANMKPATEALPKPLPMPLTVEAPKPSEPTKADEATKPTNNVFQQAPNPPFNKILGFADKTVESVKFYDINNNVLTSGKSEKGKEFNFQCANNGKIVGYKFNNEGNERDDTSILGGLGPVYCADGSILDTTVGKPQNTSLGQTSK